MREPRGDKKKVPGVRRRAELPDLAPADIRGATQDIDDRVLLPVVVDSGPRARFDAEQASPNWRFDTNSRVDSGQAQCQSQTALGPRRESIDTAYILPGAFR